MSISQSMTPKSSPTIEIMAREVAIWRVIKIHPFFLKKTIQWLGEQMQVWAKAITWIRRFTGHQVFPADIIPKARSLAALGNSSTAKGFSCRPRLHFGQEIPLILFNFFNTSSGSSRNLNRKITIFNGKIQCTWAIFQSSLPAAPNHLDVPFDQRSKMIRHASTYFSPCS